MEHFYKLRQMILNFNIGETLYETKKHAVMHDSIENWYYSPDRDKSILAAFDDLLKLDLNAITSNIAFIIHPLRELLGLFREPGDSFTKLALFQFKWSESRSISVSTTWPFTDLIITKNLINDLINELQFRLQVINDLQDKLNQAGHNLVIPLKGAPLPAGWNMIEPDYTLAADTPTVASKPTIYAERMNGPMMPVPSDIELSTDQWDKIKKLDTYIPSESNPFENHIANNQRLDFKTHILNDKGKIVYEKLQTKYWKAKPNIIRAVLRALDEEKLLTVNLTANRLTNYQLENVVSDAFGDVYSHQILLYKETDVRKAKTLTTMVCTEIKQFF